MNFKRCILFRSFSQPRLYRIGPHSSPVSRHLSCEHPTIFAKTPFRSNREISQTPYHFEQLYIDSTNLVSNDVDHGHRLDYFHGDHDEFLSRTQNGAVILFFYRPVCSVCALLESKIKHALMGHHVYTEKESMVYSAERPLFELFNQPGALAPSSVPSSEEGFLNNSKGVYAYPNDSASRTSNGFKERLSSFLRVKRLVHPRFHLDKNDSGGTARGATAVSDRGGDRSSMETKKPSFFESNYPQEQKQAKDSFQFALIDSIHFLAINTDENERLTSFHDVRNVPTFLAYLDGYIIASTEGANEIGLCKLVRLLSDEAENQKKKKETRTNSEP
ncbi:unnamed protein product [Phytomonas sp. Hart1]|nr:unnamed protein product [Phytomonas sp. Hart1]|eukprot:CCW67344.1 unnamed protein product [Phytomonas sp. isolate Hart1]